MRMPILCGDGPMRPGEAARFLNRKRERVREGNFLMVEVISEAYFIVSSATPDLMETLLELAERREYPHFFHTLKMLHRVQQVRMRELLRAAAANREMWANVAQQIAVQVDFLCPADMRNEIRKQQKAVEKEIGQKDGDWDW